MGWAILQDVSGVVLFGFLLAAHQRRRSAVVPVAAGPRRVHRPCLGRRLDPAAAPCARSTRTRTCSWSSPSAPGWRWPGSADSCSRSRWRWRPSSPGSRSARATSRPRHGAGSFPFRDLFAILFFVALGTPDRPVAVSRGAAVAWPWSLLLVIVAKAAVAYVLARVARLDAQPDPAGRRAGPDRRVLFVLAIGGSGRRGDRPDPVCRDPGRDRDQHRRFDRRGPVRPVRVPLKPTRGLSAHRVRRSHRDGDRWAVPCGTDPLPFPEICGDNGRRGVIYP